MADESENFDLDPEQKTVLFSMAHKPGDFVSESEMNDNRTNLLLELLADTLPVDENHVAILPDILKTICQDLHSVAGEPLGKLLLDSQTNLGILTKIKDYSKHIGVTEKPKDEHDVALVIYYWAIANALLYHQERITDFSSDELKNSFDSLCNQPWIPKNIVRLLAQASEQCTEDTHKEG